MVSGESMILGITCALFGHIFLLSTEMSTVQACSFPASPIYPSSFPHTPQDLETFVSSVGRGMSNSVACTKLSVSSQSDLSSALGQYWTALEKYIIVQDHVAMDATSEASDDYQYIKPVSLTWDLVIEGNCSSPVPDGLPDIHHQSGSDWDFECPLCCILAGDAAARRRFFLFQSSGHESLTLRNLALYRGGLDPVELLSIDAAIAAKNDVSVGGCAHFSMIRNLKVENVYFQDCVGVGGGGVGVLASEFLDDPKYLLKIAHVWSNVVITKSRVTGSGGGILYNIDAHDGALVFQDFHIEDSFAGISERFASDFNRGFYENCNASLFAVGTGGGMSIKSMLQTPKGTQKRTKVSVLNSTFRRNFALVELGENECNVQASPENAHGGALEVAGPVQLDFAKSVVADCQASVEAGAIAISTTFSSTTQPSMNVIRSSHFENNSAIVAFGSIKSPGYNGLQVPITWAGAVMIEGGFTFLAENNFSNCHTAGSGGALSYFPGFCGIPHPGMNAKFCSESIMAAPHLFIGDGMMFQNNSVTPETEHYSWDSAHVFDNTGDMLIMPGAHLSICPSALTLSSKITDQMHDDGDMAATDASAVPWKWNVNSSSIKSSLSKSACSVEAFVNKVEEIFAKQFNSSESKKNATNSQLHALSNSETTNDGSTPKDRQPINVTLILGGAGALAIITVIVLIAQWRKHHLNRFFPNKGDYSIMSDLSVDEWNYDQSTAALEKNFRRCNSNDPSRSSHSSASRGSEESHHAGREVVMSVINSVCTSDMEVFWSSVIAKIMARVGKLKIIPRRDLFHKRNLGCGAFKEVSICSWEGFDVAVAIMKIEAAFDLRNLEDLVQEITLLLLHQHPCMVRLFGVTEDRPGLVMEHVKTGSLFTYRRKRDPNFFTPRIMTIIALQISRGVKFLHSNGIIHFDIKCQNILIDEESNGLPICKIADLGMARKKHKSTANITAGPRGTVFWMAPELYENSDSSATEKVDVFSFGITMWELWTGHLPYEGLTDFSVMKGVKEGSLRPDIPSDCHPKWADLMKACWDLDPSNRPDFSEINTVLEGLFKELS